MARIAIHDLRMVNTNVADIKAIGHSPEWLYYWHLLATRDRTVRCSERKPFGGTRDVVIRGVGGTLVNNTEKDIKYATVFLKPYNAVKEVVYCEITGMAERGIRLTGPLSPGASRGDFYLPLMWYNPSISDIKVDRVELVYMDNTHETVPGNEIEIRTSAPEGDWY